MSRCPSTGWSRFVEVARARPSTPAFVDDRGVLSFADLLDAALRRSRVYRQRLRPGERTIIWSENSATMAAAILATWSIGAIPVLLGRETAARHLRHAAELTGAALLVTEAALLERARELVSCDTLALDEETTPCCRAQAETWPAESAGSIILTSGSTGLPKGVVQTHETLRLGQAMVARSLGVTAFDAVLCASPWSFDFGWGQLLNTLLMGATQVLAEGRGPLSITAAIERHRPTVLAITAAGLAGLTHGVSEIASRDMTSLRLMTTSGARVDADVLAIWHRRAPEAAISLNYGMTETYRSTALPPALALSHPTCVGTAIPGVSIEIVDDEARPVPTGVVGQVVHGGAGVFQGYWGDPEATARVRRMRPWASTADSPAVFTGDLGYLDAAGRLYLAGRRDRQIKAMGVRISPEEIERFILDTGLAREAAVTAMPLGVHGDAVLATIVPASGDPDEIVRRVKDACRAELSVAMRPRRIAVVDRLPRTTSGKVDYVELSRHAHATLTAGAARG